jgi:hypothetical protein
LTDLVCNTPQQVKGYDFKNATKIIKTSCFWSIVTKLYFSFC